MSIIHEADFLLLSGLQHFSFCRRQWALIHIEQIWSENGLTAEGRVIHERVHDRNITDIRNGVITMRDLKIKSDVLGITGCCDAVEFIPSENGISLNGRSGFWKVMPVEYKRGKSKVNDCDRIQTAAQAMCLEEMFCCDIPEAAVFYHKTRRRETITVDEKLRGTVRSMLSEMHDYYRKGYTPKVKPHAGCRSCSLADICIPSLMKGKASVPVSQYLDEALKTDELP